VSDGAKKP